MSLLPHTKENLHHAYFLLCEERTHMLTSLQSYLTGLGIKLVGNPDVLIREYEKMSIEDARDLKDMALSKPLGTRVCIFSVGSILDLAQNTLLKIFEEPPENTHFFIIAETDSFLLPTLRSRLFVYKPDMHVEVSDAEVKTFLAKNIPDRIKMASVIAEGGNDVVRKFLDSLEKHIIKLSPKPIDALTHIVEAKEFLLLPSAHKKGILETLALML